MKPLSMRVDDPCSEEWAEMRPRGEGRHCARCEKTVVDLSRVTRSEAERMVRAHGGSLCVRLAEDERGDATFRPERKRLPVLAEVALAGLLAACSPEPQEPAAVEREPAQILDPGDGEVDGAPLDASATSFGGSLATGVMMPIAQPHSPPTQPVVAWAEPPFSDGTPTEEQLALTRRKQRQQRQQAQQSLPPPIRHTMGVMRCPID